LEQQIDSLLSVYSGFLLGLLFDPTNGSDMLLENSGLFLNRTHYKPDGCAVLFHTAHSPHLY
jgi:hypothetical protein